MPAGTVRRDFMLSLLRFLRLLHHPRIKFLYSITVFPEAVSNLMELGEQLDVEVPFYTWLVSIVAPLAIWYMDEELYWRTVETLSWMNLWSKALFWLLEGLDEPAEDDADQ